MRHDKYTKRFHSKRNWIAAIDAFDYADPEPLSELIATEAVPAELRSVIAAIVRGDRKPDKRAAAKLKIPARERMQVAFETFASLAVLDELKFGDCDEWANGIVIGRVRLLEAVANERGEEMIQSRRYLEAKTREYIGYAADANGVSRETIENLLRDLQKKIENYPNV